MNEGPSHFISVRQKKNARLAKRKNSMLRARQATPAPLPTRRVPPTPTPEEQVATETLEVLNEFHKRYPSHPPITLAQKKEEAKHLARIIQKSTERQKKGARSPIRFDFTDTDSADFMHDDIMRTLLRTIAKLEDQVDAKDRKIELLDEAIAFHAHLAVENHDLKLKNTQLIRENRGIEELSHSINQMSLKYEQLKKESQRMLSTPNVRFPSTSAQRIENELGGTPKIRVQIEEKAKFHKEMAMMEELLIKTKDVFIRDQVLHEIDACEEAYNAHVGAKEHNMRILLFPGTGGSGKKEVPQLFKFSENIMEAYEKESKGWKEIPLTPRAIVKCPKCKTSFPNCFYTKETEV